MKSPASGEFDGIEEDYMNERKFENSDTRIHDALEKATVPSWELTYPLPKGTFESMIFR